MKLIRLQMFIYMFCFVSKLNGNVVYLYKDSPNLDSFFDFVSDSDSSGYVLPLDSGRMSFFYFRYLKSKLPDGIYYYFDYGMKDSVAIQSRPEEYYLIKAEYKDSCRHGVYRECFEFHEKRFLFKRKKRVSVSEIHFHIGDLHGDFLLFDNNGTPEEKGFFVHGQRHGFFLVYDKTGGLLQIVLYENGLYKSHSKYGSPTIISNCPEPRPTGLGPPNASSDCR